MKKKITLLFPSLLLVGTLFIAGCSSDKRDRPGPHGPSTSLTTSSSTEATSQQGTSQGGTSSTSGHVDPTSQVGTSSTPGTSTTSAGTSATSSQGVTSGNTSVSTSSTQTTSASSQNSQSTSQVTSSTSQATSSTSGSTPSVQPTGLSLPYKILTLNEGDVVALKLTATPSNASLEGLTWVSSDPSVVSISDGVVTANALGSSVITVTAPNGVSASLTIYVEEDVDDDLYVPDTTNEKIYFITEDTLGNATYDEEKDEYTFSLSDVTYE